MNRQKVKQLRNEMDKVLAELGEKHGLGIKVGNISFDDRGFTAKVEAIEADNPQDQESIDRARFERDVKAVYGLEKDDFHREFNYNGTTFKIVGVKPRSTKYPVIGENANGTRYKFILRAVKNSKMTRA